MVKNTRKKNRNKKGGAFIYEGAYGCTFAKPPLKCIDEPSRKNDKYISKLMTREEAEKEAKASFFNWGAIDPENKFSINVLQTCYLDKSNIKSSNNFNSCKKKDEYNALVFQMYGGLDLTKLTPHPNNYIPLFKGFLELMKGLKVAHDNDIVHCDIKPTNIVANVEGNNIILRFIDFGLSFRALVMMYHEPVFTDPRILYPYWPFEIGCFDDKGYVYNWRLLENKYYSINEQLTDYSNSTSLGKNMVSFDEVLQAVEETDFTDFPNVYKRLDVHSMGVTLANLLYQYFSAAYIINDYYEFYPFYYSHYDKEHYSYSKLGKKILMSEEKVAFHQRICEVLLIPLGNLISNMTHYEPNNRYTIEQAIDEYSKLISVIEKYLKPADVTVGLEEQNILFIKPDIPYVKTPESATIKQNTMNQRGGVKKHRAKYTRKRNLK